MTPRQGAGVLRKRDVEALLGRFDDDPVGALTTALRKVLDRPDATWEELLDAAGLPDDRRRALAHSDQDALDELARDLNELRTLPR
ncbi:MAG: hypothetical protein AB7Q42_13475 [Acidimicrobiia bacterium]